jgi:hypothetical protein
MVFLGYILRTEHKVFDRTNHLIPKGVAHGRRDCVSTCQVVPLTFYCIFIMHNIPSIYSGYIPQGYIAHTEGIFI